MTARLRLLRAATASLAGPRCAARTGKPRYRRHLDAVANRDAPRTTSAADRGSGLAERLPDEPGDGLGRRAVDRQGLVALVAAVDAAVLAVRVPGFDRREWGTRCGIGCWDTVLWADAGRESTAAGGPAASSVGTNLAITASGSRWPGPAAASCAGGAPNWCSPGARSVYRSRCPSRSVGPRKRTGPRRPPAASPPDPESVAGACGSCC